MEGDVSSRSYFRVGLGADETAVLASYPEELLGDLPRFVRSTELLSLAGVPVPEILVADEEAGMMLVEDLGPDTLYRRRGDPTASLVPYFQRAAELARRIGAIPATAVATLNPPLDQERLQAELAQTWELFLEPRGLTGEGVFESELAEGLEELCRKLAAGAYAPCHRDFMVRNLIPLEDAPDLAVIDHQGLRLGPLFYDLASLFNDSLFLPEEAEGALLAETLTGPRDWEELHRTAAQRCLKAVGTYDRFSRAGVDRHLALIPPTLARAARHLARVPETEALAAELRRRWDLLH